ncbi:MAG: hypothetical protein HY268_19655, partial [Deltaproteobacteria bacterium]|nr:hypothetical protein [Deltaproteobacteria bacterium]
MLDDRKCLIRLTEEALLVANTGQGFTRRGVVAICASHLGTKHNYTPSDPCPSEPDDCVLEAIRERELQTYKTNPDRIFSDFREEEEIQHDYGGRALWELLQNADDAMSPPETTPAQLIGSKGLGFKSVLELTEEPQIHSGPFHFHFSTVETRTLLQGGMPPNQDPPPLIFRIPHPGAANNGVKDLLNKGYVTIICLPLREEARPKVHKWLKDLDPRLLLFCQYLRTLELGFPDGQSRLYEVNRGDFGLLKDADITVQVVESTLGGVITEHTLHYRRWAATKDAKNGGKRHSAAICLQIKEGQLVPFADTPPLHVFFPTKESLPFRALVHASFEVEQSRQHVREMDTELFSLLGGLLARIVHEAPPAVVLGAFVPEREPSSEPAQRIWELVKAVLQECTFVPTIGGDLVKPGGTWLWSHELGTVLDPVSEAVKKSALVVPELMEFVRKPLEILGASELTVSKYPHLLQHCLNVDSEACLKAAKVLRQVVLKSSEMDEQTSNSHISTCRKVPCWWTDDGQARALEEDRPLLKSRPKQSPPKWVELDALDEQFRKRVEELLLSKEADQQGGGKRWYDLTSGHLLEADDHNLLHKVLIPTLARHPEDEWWSEHGGETLQLFVQWAGEPEFEKTSLVIWEKEERIRLAHCLKLPTNRGWLSTGQCYAGEAWGGPDSFDDFFREVTDRGVLKAPEQWPDKIQPLDPEKWKGRLRYAGVSWEPKLLRFKSSEGLRFRVQDTPPNPWMKSSKDNRGEVRNWSYWNDYCSSLKQKFPSSGTTRLREQWALEFFPECLPEEALDRISILTLMSKVVVKSYSKMEFKLDNRKSPAFVDSLAIYQLQKVAWLPCKPSLLHEDSYVAPFEAYMPGKGLGGLLPEVNVDLADGQEGRDLATFLTQTLKVRETLPGPTDKQWTEWLNKLPEVAGRSKKDITSTARELYKKILGFDRKPLESVQVKLVPCLVWSDTAGEEMRQGTSAEGTALDFRGKNDVYWLDKSYLDDQSVKGELLRKGAAIFLLEL